MKHRGTCTRETISISLMITCRHFSFTPIFIDPSKSVISCDEKKSYLSLSPSLFDLSRKQMKMGHNSELITDLFISSLHGNKCNIRPWITTSPHHLSQFPGTKKIFPTQIANHPLKTQGLFREIATLPTLFWGSDYTTPTFYADC